jgi:outer membrane protein, multidrug efflux system
MTRGRFAAFVIVAAASAGCAVGPTYRAPIPLVPSDWSILDARGTTTHTAQDGPWWEAFRDPVLARLIAQAVAANHDLERAAAAVEEARAGTGAVRAGLSPQIDAGVSTTRVRQRVPGVERDTAGRPRVGFVPIELNNFEGRFDASWEIDVFDRVRNGLAATRADLLASEEDRRDVLVTLLGDVARWYVELRGAQQRIEIANRTIRAQQEIVDLTAARRQAGLATDLDVARAEAQLESTRAVVPRLDAARATAIHRLGVLTAQPSAVLEKDLEQSVPVPVPPPDVPVGLPSDLLKRRPDIRRAEAQLIAATARVGEAKADYFPKFTLTGTAGRQATELHDLRLGLGTFFAVGPTVSLPLFTGGRIRSNVAVHEARVREAAAVYQSAVIRALEETENALVGFAREQDRRDRLDAQVKASQLALDLAAVQYRAGLTEFLTVLDAQRTLYVSQDQLAESDTAVVTHLVALYKALGGKWTPAREREP